MTEIKCKNCDKLLGKVNVATKHNDFDIEIKCPRCKLKDKYFIRIKQIEDQESQDE